MALLGDTPSTKPKRTNSSRVNPSSAHSSGPESATLQTIQSLQRQIADLEAKEEERGKLTTAQAAKMEALETELTALKNPIKPDSTPDNAPSDQAGRLAHWCPW